MQEKQETEVWSLSQEDPLEKEMAMHSSILAWKTAWTEEPVMLQFMGSQESDMTEQLNAHTFGYWVKSCVSQHSNKNSLEILTSSSFIPPSAQARRAPAVEWHPREPPLTVATFCLMGTAFANQGEITIGSCHHSPKPLSSYPATQSFPPKQFWSCLKGLDSSPPYPSS